MNETSGTESSGERISAVFAQLVIQQSNLALMLLGKAPHPQTGQMLCDLESARMFIDQLEMLEAKTKGNLDRDEQRLLSSSLMSLRMAYVEAVQKPEPASEPAAPPPPTESAGSPPNPATEPAPSDEDSKKKFTKKY